MNPDGKISASKSKADITRAEVGAALPGLEQGLRSGQLSAEHLDIVGRARKKLTEAERTCFDERAANLDQAAATMSLHQFGLHVQHLAENAQIANGTKRACRQRRDRAAKTWEDQFSGMLKLLLALDPENGARVHDAIRAEVQRLLRERRDNPTDERTLEQITADAVTNLILSGQQQRRPGATELVVLVDLRTLLDGLHEASVHETFDGTRVTPDTIRRIACDAHIIPILLGGPGELLDAGRRRRTASRQQRRALRAIYRTSRDRALHCRLRVVRSAPHHPVVAARRYRSRQSDPALQPPPSHGPRGRMPAVDEPGEPGVDDPPPGWTSDDPAAARRTHSPEPHRDRRSGRPSSHSVRRPTTTGAASPRSRNSSLNSPARQTALLRRARSRSEPSS